MSLRIAALGLLLLLTSLFGAFAACTGAPNPEGKTPDGSATDAATVDSGCWWCVDAGQTEEPTKDESTLPTDVDPDCYDACIKKGVSKDECANIHCKGNKDPNADCVNACIKKGLSEDDCRNIHCKGDPNGCYDDCIKKGGDAATCKKDCSGTKEDPKVCNDDCLKAGGKPAECELKCLGGGVPPKDKEGQACYDACIKDGGTAETCKPKCFPTQTCLDQCAAKGTKEAECNKQCATACYDACTKNGGKEADCKARCGETTPTACDKKTDPSFKGEIKPILVKGCSCHTTSSSFAANLGLNSPVSFVNKAGKSGMTAVTPGDIAKSHLVDRLEGRGDLMPKGGPALPTADIDKIKAWVCQGAKDN